MGKNFLTIVYIAMMGMVAFTACGNKENKEEAIGKSMAENASRQVDNNQEL